MTTTLRFSAWLPVAAVGVALFAACLFLPWVDAEFRTGLAAQLALAGSGVALLLAPTRRLATAPRGAVAAVRLLGLSVLVYPSVLRVADAGLGGAAMEVLGSAFHVLPITLLQLIPVLTSSAVIGRTGRGWERAIVLVAAAGFLLVGLGLSGIAGADLLLAASTWLWFASFAIAPIATWRAVFRSHGESRRAAAVAALASLVSIEIIVWCVTLGLLGAAAGFTEDGTIDALMIGLAVAAASCGAVSLAALSDWAVLPSRSRIVIVGLDVAAGVLALIIGAWGAVFASQADLPAGPVLIVGVAATVMVGAMWLRWRAWVRNSVDPGSELRRALETASAVDAEARHGQPQLVQRVLRRTVDDPRLELRFAVTPEHWVDAAGAAAFAPPLPEGTAAQERSRAVGPATPVRHETPDAAHPLVVVARGDDRTPTVVAIASSLAASRRVAALGDCTAALQPALLAARADDAERRAQEAASSERRRLRQDLHDGLQGRLLGIALNLQLTGNRLDDPAARLLVDSSVDALREAVADVRALSDNRVPERLVNEGLAAALAPLLRTGAAAVDLRLPAQRLPAHVEATAYFVISEAVSNALKHARAERVEVRMRLQDSGSAEIVVSDDGEGGADPRLGSGLRGLSERVAAAGGVLLVRAGEERGTVVEAVLPCAS